MRGWFVVLALGATGCDKQVSFVGSTRGSSFVELPPEQPVAVVRATIEVGDGGLPPRSRYAGSSLDVDVQLQHYVGCEDCTTEVDVTYVDQDLDQRVELRPGSSVSATDSILDVLEDCPSRRGCTVDVDIELALQTDGEYVDGTVGASASLLTYSRRPLPVGLSISLGTLPSE